MAQMVVSDQDVGILHDACGMEQRTEKVIPRSQCSFQISPLLANSYLHALGSLRNKLSKDGGAILWKPFWKRVLCRWSGREAVMCTRVMRKQKYEPNCLTQHLILLLE